MTYELPKYPVLLNAFEIGYLEALLHTRMLKMKSEKDFSEKQLIEKMINALQESTKLFYIGNKSVKGFPE